MALGYEQYVQSLGQTLRPPPLAEYGEASSDDLSSEWETEPDSPHAQSKQAAEPAAPPVAPKVSPWRKVRNYVRCTPFMQKYKHHRYPWVQLAGHQGNFKAGREQGTVLKRSCQRERICLDLIQNDPILPFVPLYKGVVIDEDDSFLQLEDLLARFEDPCVMDCKMGVRTYLEEELIKAKEKPKLRRDLYEKMVQVDPKAPTDHEHVLKAITKPRYMIWRETISSTALLGFRIEGVRKGDGSSTKDFKTTRTREQVQEVFEMFLEGSPGAARQYLRRLKEIWSTLGSSDFFARHEFVGSSLLFVHDKHKAGVWMIDFAKTFPVPEGCWLDHREPWVLGNHEDGYLVGLINLIDIFGHLAKEEKTE